MSDSTMINGSRLALSAALFVLALSIIYFTHGLIKLVDILPDVLDQVNHTSQVVTDVVKTVDVTNQQIPNILQEVAELRQQVPPILDEVAEYREVIPPILDEVSAVVDEVSNVREQVIPPVLKDVELILQTIPPTLDRLDILVAKADTVSRNFTENATTGFVTGIVKAPFKLVAGVGNTVFPKQKIPEADRRLLADKTVALVSGGNIGQKIAINSDTFNGEAEIIEDKTIDGQYCRLLKLTSKEYGDTHYTVCQDQEGLWQLRPNNS